MAALDRGEANAAGLGRLAFFVLGGIRALAMRRRELSGIQACHHCLRQPIPSEGEAQAGRQSRYREPWSLQLSSTAREHAASVPYSEDARRRQRAHLQAVSPQQSDEPVRSGRAPPGAGDVATNRDRQCKPSAWHTHPSRRIDPTARPDWIGRYARCIRIVGTPLCRVQCPGALQLGRDRVALARLWCQSERDLRQATGATPHRKTDATTAASIARLLRSHHLPTHWHRPHHRH